MYSRHGVALLIGGLFCRFELWTVVIRWSQKVMETRTWKAILEEFDAAFEPSPGTMPTTSAY